MKPKQTERLKWPYWLGMFLAVGVFALMNALTTYKNDDLSYMLVEGTTQRLDSLAGLWQSMCHHYMDQNGRLGDMVNKVFLMDGVGKWVFDLANTVVLVLFLVVVQRLCGVRRSATMLALTCLFLLVLMSVPAETMLWLSGSTNYLWAITATLWLLHWLQCTKWSRGGWLTHLWAAVAGFVAGGMNEGISVAVVVGLFLYYALNPRRLRGPALTACVCYVLATVFIVCSPGTLARLQHGEVPLEVDWRAMVSRRVINTVLKSGHYVTPVLAVIGAGLLWWRRGWRALAGEQLWWVFVGTLLSVMAMSLTMHRPYTAFSVISFVTVAVWLTRWLSARPQVSRVVGVVAALACVWPTIAAVRDIADYRRYHLGVEQRIAEAPREAVIAASTWEGGTRWVFPTIYDSSLYNCYTSAYCAHYDKDNVQFVQPDVLRRYRESSLLDSAVVLHLSSDRPDLAPAVMGFAHHDYATVVVPCDRVKRSFDHIEIVLEDQAARLSEEQADKRRQWGLLSNRQQWYYYWLRHGQDSCCVMLPPLPDDVESLTVPLVEADTTVRVTFKRTAPDSLGIHLDW